MSGLHVFVSRLRRQLGSWGTERLRTHSSGYALEIRDGEVDSARFLSLLSAGRASLESGRFARASVLLREGLELWRGPAYDGLPAPVLQAQARRLNEARVVAQELLMDAELAKGRHMSAAQELATLIADHPFHERFWAQRILALYRCGRQAEALECYRELRGLTRAELGLDPSPELQRLEAAVLSQDPSLDWPSASMSAITATRSTVVQENSPLGIPPELRRLADVPLSGREAELHQLEELRRSSSARSHCSVILISGEHGIGKSHLATVAADTAHAEGAHVLYGRCEDDAHLRYQPIADALRWAIEQRPEEWAFPHAREARATIGRFLRGEPVFADHSLAADRDAAFEAVVRLLRLLAERRPVLYLIDDIHHADSETSALLRYLVRRLDDRPITLLVTYRDGQLRRGSPAHRFVADVRRARLGSQLDVEGLTATAVASLVEALTGAVIGDNEAELLREEAAGNPLLVYQLIPHLAPAGPANPTLAIPDVATAVHEPCPPGVVDFLHTRLEHLRPEAEPILATASVAGREFDVEILSRAAGLISSEVGKVLDEAVSAGLLTESPDGSGRMQFVHPVLHRAIYQRLTLSERTALHSRIAEIS